MDNMNNVKSFHCSVTSCVRTTDVSPKPAVSYLIERTCRYSHNGECTLGHYRHSNKNVSQSVKHDSGIMANINTSTNTINKTTKY